MQEQVSSVQPNPPSGNGASSSHQDSSVWTGAKLNKQTKRSSPLLSKGTPLPFLPFPRMPEDEDKDIATCPLLLCCLPTCPPHPHLPHPTPTNGREAKKLITNGLARALVPLHLGSIMVVLVLHLFLV